MKKNVLIVMLLVVGIMFASEKVKVKKFSHSDVLNLEGSIEEYDIDGSMLKAYLIPLKDSNDFLIAYGKNKNEELTPMIFLNTEDESKIIYKDVNNRKVTIIAELAQGKVKDLVYFKENDSNEGFALAAQKKCIGGSTSKCIDITWTACREDPSCSFTCTLAGPSCPLAIAAACAIHCGLAVDELTPQ